MAYKNITIGEIKELHKDLEKSKNIKTWKERIRKFKQDKNISDQEALKIATRITGL